MTTDYIDFRKDALSSESPDNKRLKLLLIESIGKIMEDQKLSATDIFKFFIKGFGLKGDTAEDYLHVILSLDHDVEITIKPAPPGENRLRVSTC